MVKFQLYHGTDARISRMTDEERKAFRNDILEALDYMWSLMTPYFQQFDEVVDREHNRIRYVEKIIQFKDVMGEEMWNKLYQALSHDKARRDGLHTWQYQDNLIYLSADIRSAISYAYRSFVFGELGETLWDMYQGLQVLRPKNWSPSEKIQSTLDKALRLAEEEHVPIVYILTNFDYDQLKTDGGKSIPRDEIENHLLFQYEDEYLYLNPNDRDHTIYLRPMEQIISFVKKK